MNMSRKTLIATGIAAVLVTGCATTSSVDRKIEEAKADTNRRIESVSGQVEDLQQKQQQTDVRIEQLSQEILKGAGGVLLTEEAIASHAVTSLLLWAGSSGRPRN